MKKLISAAIVCAVGSSVFASQGPQVPACQVNGLRVSSEAIIIPAARKRLASQGYVCGSSSSGSSPAGAEHLFPGQSGSGLSSTSMSPKSMSPVNSMDLNLNTRDVFFGYER